MDFSENKIGAGTEGLAAALTRYKSRLLCLNLSKYQILLRLFVLRITFDSLVVKFLRRIWWIFSRLSLQMTLSLRELRLLI